jgi:uncharacterized membrane protein YadS
LHPLSIRPALKLGLEFSGRTLLRLCVALYGAWLTPRQLVDGGALTLVVAVGAARPTSPDFLFGFLLLAGRNSPGVVPHSVQAAVGQVSAFLIITAITALGMKTSLLALARIQPPTGPAPAGRNRLRRRPGGCADLRFPRLRPLEKSRLPRPSGEAHRIAVV